MSEKSRERRLTEIRDRSARNVEWLERWGMPLSATGGADVVFLLAELDAASAAAADRMEEAGCARLWLVSRTGKPNWDEQRAVVVAADTKSEALDFMADGMAYWGSRTTLKAQPIGWAEPGLRGVVHADFKAG